MVNSKKARKDNIFIWNNPVFYFVFLENFMLFEHPKKKDPYLPVGKPRFARGQTRVCRENNPGRPTAFWPWPTRPSRSVFAVPCLGDHKEALLPLYYTQAQKPENRTKKAAVR